MEFLLGIQCNDFVIFATDKRKLRNILCMTEDTEKMYPVGENKIMAICGEGADDVNFAEVVQRNMKLMALKNDFEPSTLAIANFSRNQLATALRKTGMYQVNILMGGYDKNVGCSLYYLDFLGSLIKIPFGCQGYGSYFALSVLDRFYRPDLTVIQATELIKLILSDIKKRFIVDFPKLCVRVVDSNGISTVNSDLTI